MFIQPHIEYCTCMPHPASVLMEVTLINFFFQLFIHTVNSALNWTILSVAILMIFCSYRHKLVIALSVSSLQWSRYCKVARIKNAQSELEFRHGNMPFDSVEWKIEGGALKLSGLTLRDWFGDAPPSRWINEQTNLILSKKWDFLSFFCSSVTRFFNQSYPWAWSVAWKQLIWG